MLAGHGAEPRDGMSRYLEYGEQLKVREVRRLPEPSAATGSILLHGPEQVFRAYLQPHEYKGASLVALGGRVAVGQLWPNLTCSACIFFIPGTIYFYWLLPLALAPAAVLDCNLGVVQSILGLVILVSFAASALTNPGIVPRQATSEDLRPRFLRINGLLLKQKFCHTCCVFRPPRSKHCAYCDNCVLRFDHHCTWLGNCIGLHNYRYFLCLIYTGNAFLANAINSVFMAIGAQAVQLYGEDAGFIDSLSTMTEEPVLLLFLLYCVALWVALTLLSIYHTVVTLRNLTTNEHVNNYYDDNPFDYGGFRNCRQIYCYPERVLAEGEDLIEVDYPVGGNDYDGGSESEHE